MKKQFKKGDLLIVDEDINRGFIWDGEGLKGDRNYRKATDAEQKQWLVLNNVKSGKIETLKCVEKAETPLEAHNNRLQCEIDRLSLILENLYSISNKLIEDHTEEEEVEKKLNIITLEL